MKHLRFDKKSTRCNRVSQDPFTHIRELYDDFIENSKYVYQPHPYLTVDEQLLPSKNHCNFLQFMASKPDKYGIKEWVLVDVKTKYCVNQFPYLGKDRSNDSNPSSTETMGSKIVKQLIEPWENCGYHITADNFFTSAPLAKYLLEKNTTFLGTLRPNSRSIARDAVMKNKELYQSDFFESDGVLMVNYHCKVKKSLYRCYQRYTVLQKLSLNMKRKSQKWLSITIRQKRVLIHLIKCYVLTVPKRLRADGQYVCFMIY